MISTFSSAQKGYRVHAIQRWEVLQPPTTDQGEAWFSGQRNLRDERFVLQCAALWDRMAGAERWSRDWGLMATAAAQRLSVSLAAFADRLYSLTQPHAESFQVGFTFPKHETASPAGNSIKLTRVLTLIGLSCSLTESRCSTSIFDQD